MLDITKFDGVFGALEPYPFSRSFIQQAESYRKTSDGVLFIDRVLSALGQGKGTSRGLFFSVSCMAVAYPPSEHLPDIRACALCCRL